MRGLYITHPEVTIEPAVPMPSWGLSDRGFARARAFAARDLLPDDTLLLTSNEQKALDLAQIIAAPRGLAIWIDPLTGENDRSATNYLPAEQFEAHVEKLFAHPDESVSGWETAHAAQQRIVAATMRAATNASSGPLVMVGHGCVGTLLKCHLAERKIARAEDQRIIAHPGGGNLFEFRLAPGLLLCEWTPIEDWTGFAP